MVYTQSNPWSPSPCLCIWLTPIPPATFSSQVRLPFPQRAFSDSPSQGQVLLLCAPIIGNTCQHLLYNSVIPLFPCILPQTVSSMRTIASLFTDVSVLIWFLQRNRTNKTCIYIVIYFKGLAYVIYGDWQVQKLQSSPAGWRPKEELMLHLSLKALWRQNSFLLGGGGPQCFVS